MSQLNPIVRIAWASSTMRDRRATQFDQNLRERIIRWEYIDKSSGADKGKLVLDNSDLSLLDHEAITPSGRLYVQWGYPHLLHPVKTLTVEKIKGFLRLEIEGSASEARRFSGAQKTRTWENATEFEVAEEIALFLGFRDTRSRRIESGDITTRRRGISQAGETDMAFLLRLASRIGCVFFITDGIFHFHERSLGIAPVRTITYWNDQDGEIIGEPQIEHNIQGRPGSVNQKGRNPRERSDVSGSASNREDISRPVLGEELPCSDPTGISWEDLEETLGVSVTQSIMPTEEEAQSGVSPTTAETDNEAKSEAQQKFRSGERSSIKMALNLIGSPDIQADDNVKIEGIGQKYSGNYHIKEATHSVASGQYRTNLKLERNATSRSRGTASQRRRANDQATASVPSESDVSYSSVLNPWDCQGSSNTSDPIESDVRQFESTDPDGQSIIRYEARGRGSSRAPSPIDEG